MPKTPPPSPKKDDTNYVHLIFEEGWDFHYVKEYYTNMDTPTDEVAYYKHYDDGDYPRPTFSYIILRTPMNPDAMKIWLANHLQYLAVDGGYYFKSYIEKDKMNVYDFELSFIMFRNIVAAMRENDETIDDADAADLALVPVTSTA